MRSLQWTNHPMRSHYHRIPQGFTMAWQILLIQHNNQLGCKALGYINTCNFWLKLNPDIVMNILFFVNDFITLHVPSCFSQVSSFEVSDDIHKNICMWEPWKEVLKPHTLSGSNRNWQFNWSAHSHQHDSGVHWGTCFQLPLDTLQCCQVEPIQVLQVRPSKSSWGETLSLLLAFRR